MSDLKKEGYRDKHTAQLVSFDEQADYLVTQMNKLKANLATLRAKMVSDLKPKDVNDFDIDVSDMKIRLETGVDRF